MSIRVVEDGRELAEFSVEEVTRIVVEFAYGRATWICEGKQWRIEGDPFFKPEDERTISE